MDEGAGTGATTRSGFRTCGDCTGRRKPVRRGCRRTVVKVSDPEFSRLRTPLAPKGWFPETPPIRTLLSVRMRKAPGTTLRLIRTPRLRSAARLVPDPDSNGRAPRRSHREGELHRMVRPAIAASPGFGYSTTSISPGRQVLSNHGSSGP